MTRTMYDAVNVSGVPAGATLVAGYGDGLYRDVDAFKARFPAATVVVIAVSSRHNLGTVLDVETGDATPAEAPPWVLMRRAAGVDPTIYCNSSTWPSVRAAFQAAGVAQPHYWIAQYDNVPSIPASWTALGCVAKQYADPGPYDLSVVADFWPGVDTNPQEADMPFTDADANTLMQHQVPDLALPDGHGGFKKNPIIQVFERAGDRHNQVVGLLSSLTAQVGALTALLQTLAKGGTLTVAQAEAAAKAGAAAALAEAEAAAKRVVDALQPPTAP